MPYIETIRINQFVKHKAQKATDKQCQFTHTCLALLIIKIKFIVDNEILDLYNCPRTLHFLFYCFFKCNIGQVLLDRTRI